MSQGFRFDSVSLFFPLTRVNTCLGFPSRGLWQPHLTKRNVTKGKRSNWIRMNYLQTRPSSGFAPHAQDTWEGNMYLVQEISTTPLTEYETTSMCRTSSINCFDEKPVWMHIGDAWEMHVEATWTRLESEPVLLHYLSHYQQTNYVQPWRSPIQLMQTASPGGPTLDHWCNVIPGAGE